MYILLGLLIGVSVVIATILNGKLAERIGLINDVIINYAVAVGTSVIIILIMGEKIPQLDILIDLPVFYYLGGFLGIAVIFTFNIIVPKIPAVYIFIIPFIGQILTSSLIDYLYLDILSKGKILGGFLVLVGLLYNIRVEKKFQNEV